MNPGNSSDLRAELLDLYRQWKCLTEAEGAAILASDWIEVQRCQKAKQKLQPEIIQLTDQSQGAPNTRFDAQVRECVNELIQLETRNNATLGKRLDLAEKERADLDRTSNRLRQVHRSYVPTQAPVWNQYS